MTSEEAKKKIDELIERIDYYNERYYQDSVSEISDYDFDQLLKKLEQLEADFQKQLDREQKKLAKKKSRGCRCNQGQNKTRIAVEQPQTCNDLVGWHNTDLYRQHQGQEDKPEKNVFEGKTKIDNGIGGNY